MARYFLQNVLLNCQTYIHKIFRKMKHVYALHLVSIWSSAECRKFLHATTRDDNPKWPQRCEINISCVLLLCMHNALVPETGDSFNSPFASNLFAKFMQITWNSKNFSPFSGLGVSLHIPLVAHFCCKWRILKIPIWWDRNHMWCVPVQGYYSTGGAKALKT